jgi:porin
MAADAADPASTPPSQAGQDPAQQSGPAPGLNRVGQTLQDAGVDVHGLIVDQGVSNVSMGQSPGHASNEMLILPAVDLDMEKIAHIPGGTIHLLGTIWTLDANVPGITSQIGGILGGYITAPTTTSSEFSLATYEQRLFNGALDIEAGRTNANRYFDLPNCLAFFSCFSPTISVDADIAPPPYAVWGGRVKVNLGPHAYVQGGAFEDNYLDAAHTQSIDFTMRGAVGTLVMAETGYHTDFSTDPHPRSYAGGVFYDTAGHGTFKGTPFPYAPTSGRYPYDGGKGVYISGRQTVWTGDRTAGGTPSNIAVYGHLSAAVAEPQPVDLDAYAGVVAQGLLPGRPFDTVGLKVQYERLDPLEAAFETQARIAAGGPNSPQSPNSFLVQLNGYFQLTSWAGIQPDVSYFIDPDSYYNPFTPRKPQDGFMVGAQLLISLGTLMGTSSKPF